MMPNRNIRLLALLALLATGVLSGSPVIIAAPAGSGPAAQDAQAKIDRIKQERHRLQQIRQRLEKKLGALGLELKRLDQSLVEARKASREARQRVQAANRELNSLLKRKQGLQQRINLLHERLKDEVVAAWQRSARSSQWLGVFTGQSVSDIPHRRYLLNTVMQSQEEDRRQYQQSVAEMQTIEADLIHKRDQLEVLSEARKQAELTVAEKFEQKRSAVNKVRSDVHSKKKKEARLARQQQALLDLLERMDQGLLPMDQPRNTKQVRKRKGRLDWPLAGKIIASFGSRSQPGRAKLKGVQLRPGKIRQVKSMAAGQVRYADWFGGYGLMTIVDYGDGILGVYAHNDVLYRQLGDWVEEGEALAEAGSTGWVNDVELYFEIRDKGQAVNPKRWCHR